MRIHKLETTDAFIAFDLDEVAPALGPVRVAPKILRDGAQLLARSRTYTFASFEQQVGGASAGINARGDARDEAVAAFLDEVRPLVADQRFFPEPAKGLGAEELADLREVDTRSALYWEHGDGLRGLGAAVCADAAVGGLQGRTVAVEGFDGAGPELARSVHERGGRVVAVSTPGGSVRDPNGLDAAALAEAWHEHGPALAENLEVAGGPADQVWAAGAEVLFTGSRAGVVDHEVAGDLSAAAVVPTGPVPVTAKALAVLRRSGIRVLPDFLTTAAPIFALWADDDTTLDGVRASASVAMLAALGEVLDDEDGPLLGACYRAEAYLRSWRDELPFGRPLA